MPLPPNLLANFPVNPREMISPFQSFSGCNSLHGHLEKRNPFPPHYVNVIITDSLPGSSTESLSKCIKVSLIIVVDNLSVLHFAVLLAGDSKRHWIVVTGA